MASTSPHRDSDDLEGHSERPPFAYNPKTLGGTPSLAPTSSVSASHSHNHTFPALSQDIVDVSKAAAMNRWPDIRSNPLRIPNLLGEGRRSVLGDIAFRLKVRDQPRCARSCGLGENDRRPIDPAPIVELAIESTRLSDSEVEKYRCFEGYVMHCSILDDTGERDVSRNAELEYDRPNLLMGSVTATPSVVKDGTGKEGCFFVFNDLSCRTTGSYRLMFRVVMIGHGAEGASSGPEKRRPFLATVKSDIFNVYNAKEFPGVSELSALALSMKAQGCIKRKQVRNLQ